MSQNATFPEIAQVIHDHTSFILLSHIRPDGDAIGSQIALGHSLEAMGKIVLGNQNLAVVYGFGLIVLAIVMGLIYSSICTGYEKKYNKEEE